MHAAPSQPQIPVSIMRAPSFVSSLVFAGLVVAACRDSSAPAPIAIALEAFVTRGPTVTEVDGSTQVECAMRVDAIASGGGAATWESGALYFYSGKDRSVAQDTIPLPPDTLANYWNATGIEAGQVQQMRLLFRAPFPFGVKVEVRYRPASGGRVRTAAADLVCGPVAGTNAVPPAVTALSVEPATGRVEPGQTITVHFTAQSPIGLLRSEVRLSGACTQTVSMAELLAPTATRSVAIPLPVPCRTDVPLVVTVTATDGAREEASREMSMTLTTIDLTPPSLDLHFSSQLSGGVIVEEPGTHFHGDSVVLLFNAYDIQGLAALVWEVLPAGVKDSLVFPPGSTGVSSTLRIPVRSTWGTGPIQLRFHARDASGLVSPPLTTAAGATRVYPTVDRPSRSRNFDGEVRGLAVDGSRGVFYLLQSYPDAVAIVSLSTLAITRTIHLDTRAGDMDLTPSGDSLVVTLPDQNALGVIDLRLATTPLTLIPLTVLDQTVRQTPSNVRTTATGKALVSLGGLEARASQLLEVDLATGAQRIRLDAGDQGFTGFGKLERSQDGTAILLQGGEGLLQRLDVPTDRFGSRGSSASSAPRASLDATGDRIAIGADIFDAALNPVRSLEPTGGSSILSPDGEYLYGLSWNSGIVRSRVSDGAILDRTINPIGAQFMRISADGVYIVTAGHLINTTSRIAVIEMR